MSVKLVLEWYIVAYQQLGSISKEHKSGLNNMLYNTGTAWTNIF